MGSSRFDSESGPAARRDAVARLRVESEERKQAFRDRTPPVLMDAIHAAFSKEGCTPAQKRLVHNYATAWIYDADVSVIELLAASLSASRTKP